MAYQLEAESHKKHQNGYYSDLSEYIPDELKNLHNPQTDIPKIAKNLDLMSKIEHSITQVPTYHKLMLGDAREIVGISPNTIHLILTSPPYWTLKRYGDGQAQLGHIADYATFLVELNKVWKKCYEVLVPGGRLICVVGDVCLSRKKNDGRHTVVPLHASIQENCRVIGFDNLAPIIWHKIANIVHEVENGSSFLGKPYEPNAVIKNDIEFILMQRKPGGYRRPSIYSRILSIISDDNHKKWFSQIWYGITGSSTKNHPAPFPLELAERLIRMFSFAGDTIMDPFVGTGTTMLAAAKWGRNSIGIEVDKSYFVSTEQRIKREANDLFRDMTIDVFDEESECGQ